MDELTQKKFDEIIKKESGALTNGDIAFLKARRSYLTKTQIQDYADILDKKVELTESSSTESTPNTSTLSYKELQRKARLLGLPYIGIHKDELLRSIDRVEGPGGADRPE